MSNSISREEAIGLLFNCAAFERRAYDDLLAYWEPDPPPVTIVFAKFGDWIAETDHLLSDERRRVLWSTIERLLTSGSDDVQTAVATGLLETMMHLASARMFSFASIAAFLGPEMRKYCDAYDAFTGTKTPGLK